MKSHRFLFKICALRILPLALSLLRTFLGLGVGLGWNTVLQVKNWQVLFGRNSDLDDVFQITKLMRELIGKESKRWREKQSHRQGKDAVTARLTCCEWQVKIKMSPRMFFAFEKQLKSLSVHSMFVPLNPAQIIMVLFVTQDL